MNRIDKTRPILTELVIGMMFFLVCSALLLRLFGGSFGLARKTGLRNAALNAGENVIDTLLTAEDPSAALTALGFDENGLLDAGDYRLKLDWEKTAIAGGCLYQGTLTAGTDAEAWFTLPVSVCSEVRA